MKSCKENNSMKDKRKEDCFMQLKVFFHLVIYYHFLHVVVDCVHHDSYDCNTQSVIKSATEKQESVRNTSVLNIQVLYCSSYTSEDCWDYSTIHHI